MSFGKAFWALTFVAIVAFLMITYPSLPEIVATHFNSRGPDGWMAKSSYLQFGLVFTSLMNLCFAPMASESLARKIPPSLINIPCKKYWLDTNPDEFYRRLTGVIALSAGFMNIIMGIVYVVVWGYNTQRLGLEMLHSIVWAVVGLSFAIIIPIFLAFRPPKDDLPRILGD